MKLHQSSEWQNNGYGYGKRQGELCWRLDGELDPMLYNRLYFKFEGELNVQLLGQIYWNLKDDLYETE